MNNEKKEFFTNDVEVDVGGEEIILAPPTELIEEAKEIAQSTKSDEKFPFYLQYDVNQKEFLMSMLQTVAAVVEKDDEENYTLSTKMNMTQLALIKRLDCVERVRTNEGMNPFTKDHMTPELETNASKISTVENSIESTYVGDGYITDALNYEAYAESAAASPRSSCSSCSCPTNVSMETAATICDESYTSGYICCPGAEQWFMFTATQSGQYTICTKGRLDTIGTLYDVYGNKLAEEDNYAPCGSLNFRIIRNLTKGRTYYVKVCARGNATGNYYLRVTKKTLAESVFVSPHFVSLKYEEDKIYELPALWNTFRYNEKAFENIYVNVYPTNADEKKVIWYSSNPDVLRVDSTWYEEKEENEENKINKVYHMLTVVGKGIAELYAFDFNEDGKSDKCVVVVSDDPQQFKDVLRVKHDGGINVMERSTGGAILGTFANETEIFLIDETPQNEHMYHVYGRMTNGVFVSGWCSGEYLEKKVNFLQCICDNDTINVRSSAKALVSGENKVGSISKGEEVQLLSEEVESLDDYSWYNVFYIKYSAYVVADYASEDYKKIKKWIPFPITLSPISFDGYLNDTQRENNARIVHNFLARQGWTLKAICAALGNMEDESSINPGKNEDDGGHGYGLVQWDFSKEYLMNYLAANNYSTDSLYGQLECLLIQCEEGSDYWNTSNNYPADLPFINFSDFRYSENYNLETLTRIFLWAFEKPDIPHETLRIENAQKWYDFFN